MFTRRVFCFGMFALQVFGEPVQDEIQAKNRALSFSRALLDLPQDKFLRATRREDWEDEVFGVQVKIVGQIRKAVMLFEISDTGYEIISDREVLYHSTTHGKNNWIVGIDVSTEESYGLFGFDKANENFNELVGKARIRIHSSEEARAWGYAFVQLVLGPSRGRPLGRRRDLQRFIEDAFDSGHTSKWRAGSADEWLGRLKGIQVEPTVESIAEDFELSLTFLTSPSDGPNAQRLTLRIKPNGQILILASAQMYPPRAAIRDTANRIGK